MKKSLFILGFTLASVFSFAKSNAPLSENKSENTVTMYSDQQKQSIEYINALSNDDGSQNTYVFKKNSKDFYDCEVTVKANVDGNKVDVVVTIYDVSWVGCQSLKAAVKLALATL